MQYYCIWKNLKFLNGHPSKPQQLSTYALTLFQYRTHVEDKDVRVGEYLVILSCVKFVQVYEQKIIV